MSQSAASVMRTRYARMCTALMGSVLMLTSAHMAQAGINVWTRQGPPGGTITTLAIDPLTPSTLYAVTSDSFYDNGVYRSTDGGATWSAASAGLARCRNPRLGHRSLQFQYALCRN